MLRGFSKKKKPPKKKKSETPNNINPFILEVTKKGIKLQDTDGGLFQTTLAKPINFIPRLLSHQYPWRLKSASTLLNLY